MHRYDLTFIPFSEIGKDIGLLCSSLGYEWSARIQIKPSCEVSGPIGTVGCTDQCTKPKVYFEEWDEPMISGIGWVSELIEAAGGVDVFADRASGKSAKDRIVTAEQVIRLADELAATVGFARKRSAQLR